jgi:hypothetical protein
VWLQLGGGWQAGASPYNGKYGPLQHPYVAAAGGDPSSGSAGYYYDVKGGGQWDTSTDVVTVDCLFQHNNTGQAAIEVWEIKALIQDWVVVANNGPRTVAAVNSGAW